MTGFSLRDLELFVAVVDAGSITSGAHAVGLSLSSASTRITRMEDRQGLGLLRRHRAGVVPTAAGEALAGKARALLAKASELERVMGGFREGPAEPIRMASNTSAVDALTEFLAASLARFPAMRVTVTETTSVEAAVRVREGSADLGVVSALADSTGLAIRELWADPLVIIARSAHRAKAVTTFEDAVRGPLIGLPHDSPLQTLIDDRARLLAVTPVYRVRLPTLEAVHAVASTGAGAAIVPHGTARRLRAAPETVHPIDDGWARRRALLVTRSAHSPSRAQQQFIDALLRYRDEQGVPREDGARRRADDLRLDAEAES